MLIVLEGIDNCGKNTIAQHLLLKNNYVIIDFPDYNSDIGKLIKLKLYEKQFDPLSLQLLFSCERLSKKNKLIALSENNVVISTRYKYSAIAYGIARGLDRELMYLLEKDMPEPDLKIFIDITPEESLSRAINPDNIEKDKLLLYKVREEYMNIVSNDSSWIVINGMKKLDNIINEIENIIKRNNIYG